MTKRVVAVASALVLAVSMLVGCASGTSIKTAPTTGTTITPSSTAPAATGAVTVGTVKLGDKDDGRTIGVATGSTILVVLGSTYWMFPTAPKGAVLQQMGGVSTAPAPFGTCVPGGGCGTVSVTYKVVGTGQTQISASRTSCGEAMGCTGKAGSYTVAVVATAG